MATLIRNPDRKKALKIAEQFEQVGPRELALNGTEGSFGIPEQMAAFFDGRQIDIFPDEGDILPGYAA